MQAALAAVLPLGNYPLITASNRVSCEGQLMLDSSVH